jgi:hypothetical protein
MCGGVIVLCAQDVCPTESWQDLIVAFQSAVSSLPPLARQSRIASDPQRLCGSKVFQFRDMMCYLSLT